MHFNQRKARVARVVAYGAVTLGAAATIAAQTHPAAAAEIFAAVNSAITCATTGACVSGTNTKGGYGVEGTSKAGYGVFGLSKGTGTGVFGGAQSGWGMYGYSNKNDGVKRCSSRPTATRTACSSRARPRLVSPFTKMRAAGRRCRSIIASWQPRSDTPANAWPSPSLAR